MLPTVARKLTYLTNSDSIVRMNSINFYYVGPCLENLESIGFCFRILGTPNDALVEKREVKGVCSECWWQEDAAHWLVESWLGLWGPDCCSLVESWLGLWEKESVSR